MLMTVQVLCRTGYSKIPVLIIDDYLKNIYTTYTQGKENTDEALNKVKEALNKDKNNPQIKFDLALLYLFKQNYVKSIIELQDAIEYKRKQQDTSDIYAYFRLMGLGYMNLKMYEDALSLFTQCSKEYEYRKDYRSLMLIFTNTASLYTNQNKYDSAFKFYYKAMEVCHKFPSVTDSTTKSLTELSLAFLHSRTANYDSCYHYFEKVTRNSSLPARIKNAAYLYVIPALVHDKLFDKAIEYFEKSEDFFFRSGMYRVVHDTYSYIIPAYIAKKQYDKILFYQKRWTTCADSNAVRMDKIALQKAEIQKILQEKQILQKEIDIKMTKIRQRNTVILLLIVIFLLFISLGLNYYHRLNLKRIRENEQLQVKLNQELQEKHRIQAEQIRQLEENKKLQEFIQNQLEQEVQKRTDEIINKEKEIIALKEQEIQSKIEKAELEALTQSLLIQQKNQIFEQVKEHIEKLKTQNLNPEQQKSLKELISVIKSSLNIEQQWDNFKVHFEANYPTFMQKIIQEHPNLSESEVRHLAYIKMGLSIKEVANLLGIEVNSVKMARYRIKQKLGMGKEDSLTEKIQNI